jgi:hypothetical protein
LNLLVQSTSTNVQNEAAGQYLMASVIRPRHVRQDVWEAEGPLKEDVR